MKYLPLFFHVDEKPCLVVGGGNVAARKVRTLIKAQANIVIVAPDLRDDLIALHSQKSVEWKQKKFEPADVQNYCLVIAASDDEHTNNEVSQAARKRNIPVNVVDSPELSTFIFPSIVDRDPVTIAVSTAGQAPVLARMLRSRIESLLPSNYGALATFVDKYRAQVKSLLPDIDQRKAFWENVLHGPISELILSKQQQEAEQQLERLLSDLQASDSKSVYQGEVYLVGAGPGDPDLMTFRALRLLQQADVVLYDRLVSEEIVNLARQDAERIYVGKSRLEHAVEQPEINALLVKLAKSGKRVCRLKGGDPFIFGRGGEEIETLFDEGVSFQVVPGITAASGCAAYAGIPLTHRDYAQSVLFVAGHRRLANSQTLDWQSLVVEGQTLVFYMGLSEIQNICEGLVNHGMKPQMPAALIQQGTTTNQKVLVGNLLTLPDMVKTSEIKAPTLIIVGEVVRLRDKLRWYG